MVPEVPPGALVPVVVLIYAALVTSVAALIATSVLQILLFCLVIWATVGLIKFADRVE